MGQDGYNAVFQLAVCLDSTFSGPGTFLVLLKWCGDAVGMQDQLSLVQGRDANGSTSVLLHRTTKYMLCRPWGQIQALGDRVGCWTEDIAFERV